MAITEDLRKRITDPTPFYVVAGAADLAAEKLKEAPALIDRLVAETPERIAAVRETDPKAVQQRVTQQAQQTQAKLTELFGSLDTDIKKLRETAQDLTLQGVGRVAEYAVRARDTYDELAERGRGAVQNWRGDNADDATDTDGPADATAEAIEAPGVATARDTSPRRTRPTHRIATPPVSASSASSASTNGVRPVRKAGTTPRPVARPAGAAAPTGGSATPATPAPATPGAAEAAADKPVTSKATTEQAASGSATAGETVTGETTAGQPAPEQDAPKSAE
ncbi:hypothetical protein ACMA1D_27145 [Streptomyces sp. 796.1]|uniref:hypothetical protein n=1 Tax=Streptomyces sp. 796.1 TaxID=3163029 RepID=UPI0039C94255